LSGGVEVGAGCVDAGALRSPLATQGFGNEGREARKRPVLAEEAARGGDEKDGPARARV